MKEQSFYGFREKGKSARYQSFALEIVGGCQLRCGNCYRTPAQKLSLMPSTFVKKMIREAKEMGFAEIVLIGGEPTLHPELPRFIEFILEEGLSPILCTNGIRLADKKYCSNIIREGMTIVIHGLVPTSYKTMDDHVKMNGYMEKLVKAYKNVEAKRTKNITIVAEAVVIKPFLPHLLDFHIWCRNNGYIPFVELNRRGNNGELDNLSVSPEEVFNIFGQLQIWDLNNAENLTDHLLTPPAYGNKCTMSITGLHIKNFGHGNYGGVYSCCAQTVKHGDLKKQSLAEILADTGMLVFKNQDDWIVGPCRQCQYYFLCKGGCRGEAALTFKCARASCPTCWHIPKEIRNNPLEMAPKDCSGCPLEEKCGCHLQ